MLLQHLSQQLSCLFLANMFICIRSGIRYTGRFKHVYKPISQLQCFSFLLFIELKRNKTTAKKTPRGKKTTPSLVLLSTPFTTPTERENAEEKQQQSWDFIFYKFSQTMILGLFTHSLPTNMWPMETPKEEKC